MIGKNMATNAFHLSVTVAEVKTALQSARERSKFRESESTRLKHRERTVVHLFAIGFGQCFHNYSAAISAVRH